MNVIETKIKGLLILEPKVFGDPLMEVRSQLIGLRVLGHQYNHSYIEALL